MRTTRRGGWRSGPTCSRRCPSATCASATGSAAESSMPNEAPDRTAEVLRLSYVEGLGVRAIARRLSMARKTVRKLLGRGLPERKDPAAPSRASVLDQFVPQIQSWLVQTPALTAPAVLQRLRPLGDGGGGSALRARVRALRPPAKPEAFLTLDFRPGG